MIVEYLVEWSLGLVGWLLSLLPDDSVDWPDVSGLGEWFGSSAGPLDAVLPVSEMIDIFGLVVNVILPATIVFRLALFTYGKLPVVGQ